MIQSKKEPKEQAKRKSDSIQIRENLSDGILLPENSGEQKNILFRKNGLIILFSIVLLCCFPLQSLAFSAGEIVAEFSWGDGDFEFGKLETFDGVYGPSSFVLVDDTSVMIVDSIHNRLLNYDIETSQLSHVGRLPDHVKDIAISDKGRIFLLTADSVVAFAADSQSKTLGRIPESCPFVSGLTVHNDELYMQLSGGDSFNQSRFLSTRIERESLFTGHISGGYSYQLERVDDVHGRVIRYTQAGILDSFFEFPVEEYTLQSLQLIGTDGRGNVYLEVELLISESPIAITRRVYCFRSDGELIDTIELPNITATYAFKDLRVTESGTIFHLLRSPEALYLIQWSPEDEAAEHNGINRLDLSFYHYNNTLPRHTLDIRNEDSGEGIAESISLTRTEALDIAASYVNHTWYASSCSIGSSYCGGKTVTTPSWVTVGSHQRVPYKWGGFSSLSQFDSGLSACDYAGDNNCTGGGSSCAVGVDCSGFVSRCWKTTTKYGTSTLPNISYAISINEMKSGDIFNRAGSHVRMFVSQNANGTFNCVESYAGSNYWRVDYTVRTASDNASYTPRRCDWITDDYDPNRPGTMQNPIIISSLPYSNSNTTLNGPSDVFDYYSCAPSTNESGPELFYKLTLTTPSTITVSVSDGSGIDVDVHLLTSLSANSCIARNDISFTVNYLSAGTYYITADTWVSSSGYEYAGPYTITVQRNN